MDGEVRVTRSSLAEVQRIAAAYRREVTGRRHPDAAGPRRPGPPPVPLDPPLPAGAIFWLARDADGTAVGYAAGTLRPEGLVLGPFYVRRRHRRGGIGLALLRAAERWADDARIPVVEVSVAADNAAGLAFLGAAGYETRRVLMARGGDAHEPGTEGRPPAEAIGGAPA